MEPAQRRAVLAILGMLETGIQQLRILFEDTDNVAPRPVMEAVEQPKHVQKSVEYLAEEEEAELEKELEAQRLEMIADAQKAAHIFWETE